MSTTEEIQAQFLGERYRKGDWVIANLQYKTGAICPATAEATATGEAAPNDLKRNRYYRFFGQWVEHPSHGRQFNFTSFAEAIPPGRDGICLYLGRHCPGIGPYNAGVLFDKFGERAVEVVRTEPETVAALLPRFTIDQAREAAAILESMKKFEAVRIELTEMFAGRGFPRKTIDRVLQRWKGRATDFIRRDAYLLMTAGISGIGFKRADQLYLDNGGNPNRLKRQTLAAWYSLDSDSTGDTWIGMDQVLRAMRSQFKTGSLEHEKAIRLGLRAKWLSERKDGRRRWLTSHDRDLAEQLVAAKVAQLQCTENRWPCDVGGITEHQAEALYQATLGPFGILSGSPGTGKTFTLAALIRQLFDRAKECDGPPPRIYVCAPTGKAAVRCSEALAKHGFAAKARTIHQLLGVSRNGHDGDGWGFVYNAANPLPPGYLFIDEASMVDVSLFAALLEACTPGMHILLVGDTHQLAPVAHGAPLRDLIAAGLPCGELREIHRNAGTIVKVCRDIKDNKPYWCDRTLDTETGKNLVHFDANHPVGQVAKLHELLTAIRNEGRWDMSRDVQILCTVNKKSEISREELNKTLQDLLNPGGEQFEGSRFRIDDKVICLKNKWLPLAGMGDEEEWVANGELGIVEHVERSKVIVNFPNPERVVEIPSGKHEDGGMIVDLGYAITVWKSQGSEWPIVIVMADSSHGANWISSRELIYTAVSRASHYAATIGQLATIRKQCRKVSTPLRKTFLKERVVEELQGQLVGEGF